MEPAELAGRYTTRPQAGHELPVAGVWKTKRSSSPSRRTTGIRTTRACDCAREFLTRTEWVIDEAGQAQLTLPIPATFQPELNGAKQLVLTGQCRTVDAQMLIEMNRPLGLTRNVFATLVVQRPDPGGEARPNLLVTMRLTFIGNMDMFEGGGRLEMVRQ